MIHQELDRFLKAARQFNYPPDTAQTLRALFRAVPGLAVVGNHYTYKTPDGRVLWGNPTVDKQVQGLDLKGEVVLEHRTNFRTVHRSEGRKEYYARRDQAQVEANNCFLCGDPHATETADTDWRYADDGVAITAQVAPVCSSCKPKAVEKSRYWIRKLGHDPDGLVRERVEIPS